MASFKRPSKAVQLGNKFLTNLGDQKNEVAKKAAKMDQRAARMASSSALPVSEAPKAAKVSVKDLAPNATEEDLTEEESSDGFVNPFLAAQAPAKPSLDLEQLENHLEPKLEEIRALIESRVQSVVAQVALTEQSMKHQAKQSLEEMNSISKELTRKQKQVAKDIEKMHENSKRLKKSMDFDLNQLAEQMGAEKADFQKIKRTMKLDMQAELQKVREYTARTSVEMQRVNSLLESQR